MIGIKLMRDTMFQELQAPFPFLWLQFFTGLFLVVFGIWFIAGFVRYRDRKNNKVAFITPKEEEKSSSSSSS
ncbi:DUF2627 family protein [Aliibacillus thermotolerans]|nr:DUF2627 family protein [Aliibacillus thermotolerans]